MKTMKPNHYLNKDTNLNVAEEVKLLTDWHDTLGLSSLIQMVSERHVFMTTRALQYRTQLEDIGINVN